MQACSCCGTRLNVAEGVRARRRRGELVDSRAPTTAAAQSSCEQDCPEDDRHDVMEVIGTCVSKIDPLRTPRRPPARTPLGRTFSA